MIWSISLASYIPRLSLPHTQALVPMIVSDKQCFIQGIGCPGVPSRFYSPPPPTPPPPFKVASSAMIIVCVISHPCGIRSTSYIVITEIIISDELPILKVNRTTLITLAHLCPGYAPNRSSVHLLRLLRLSCLQQTWGWSGSHPGQCHRTYPTSSLQFSHLQTWQTRTWRCVQEQWLIILSATQFCAVTPLSLTRILKLWYVIIQVRDLWEK